MKWMTLLLSCLCLNAFGQDYLVTHKGDTLRGKIKILSYDKLDRVQVADQKKTILTAVQVKTIFTEGAFFHPIQTESAIRFMKLLKPGYLSLYAFREENQSTYSGRLLVKKDGRMIELPNLAFKKSMIDFLKDSKEIKEKLESKEYSKKDLDEIIDAYNAFIEANTQARNETYTSAQKANRKIGPLEKLKETVQSQKDFDSKQDALDLIDDIMTKLKAGQTIPNYLIDGLQKYLTGNDAIKEDLENAINSLKD